MHCLIFHVNYNCSHPWFGMCDISCKLESWYRLWRLLTNFLSNLYRYTAESYQATNFQANTTNKQTHFLHAECTYISFPLPTDHNRYWIKFHAVSLHVCTWFWHKNKKRREIGTITTSKFWYEMIATLPYNDNKKIIYSVGVSNISLLFITFYLCLDKNEIKR